MNYKKGNMIQKMVLDANKMFFEPPEDLNHAQKNTLHFVRQNWSQLNFVEQRLYMLLVYLKNQSHKFTFEDFNNTIIHSNILTLGRRAFVLHFNKEKGIILSTSDDHCYLCVHGKQFKLQIGYKEFVNHYILNLMEKKTDSKVA